MAPDSHTETFVALKLSIDNWRWADVPFYIRTGKRLAKRVTGIAIQFRRAPFVLFRDTGVEQLSPNLLVLHIQPDEGISLRFGAKVPGPRWISARSTWISATADYFGDEPSTGYERLLYDCMTGDATLFQRADMVEAGWSVVSRCSTCGRRCRRAIFRTTPPEPGGRKKPKICSRARAVTGGSLLNPDRRHRGIPGCDQCASFRCARTIAGEIAPEASLRAGPNRSM